MYQGGCIKEDQTSGVHVLRYLQRRFAPVDDIDEQVEARRNLEALARSNNKRMTHFNARFNAQVQYVRSCGIPILPRDQLPQYLRTLRSCEARDIYYQVCCYIKRIASGESFTLTDVQEGLQQCDDKAQRDKRSQATSTGRHQQSTQHDLHSSSASNTSSEPTIHSRAIECWSCGENHPLSACPTTSVADQKRIYNTHRNASHNSSGDDYGDASSTTGGQGDGGRGSGRGGVQGSSASGSNTPAFSTSTSPASGIGTSASSASANATLAASRTQQERVTYANAMSSTQPLPIVTYEDHVNLDSGASDHMHPTRANLTDVVPYITNVILPNGADIKVTEAGTLRVSCLDLLQRLRHTIPLLNTLHVLGLQMTLWSVIQFAQCGHTIIFGDTTIRIIMHEGRPESFELRLSHPFYQPREHPFGYCIKLSTYANCVTTTGSVNATPAPIKEFEEGPVVTGPTRELEEGP